MNRNRSDMGIMGEDTGYSIAHGEAVAAYLFFLVRSHMAQGQVLEEGQNDVEYILVSPYVAVKYSNTSRVFVTCALCVCLCLEYCR